MREGEDHRPRREVTMGMSTKGRRKLNVNGRNFVWFVCDDNYSADLVLHVSSHDKQFLVHYHLGQAEDRRVVTVIGKEFSGVFNAGQRHRHVLSPQWEQQGRISPAAVRRMISGVLCPTERRVERLFTGQLIDSTTGQTQ